MVNTDKVRVKINGVYTEENNEYRVCGVLFTGRKIKVDSEKGSTLVSLRKDLVSADTIKWEYANLDFQTVKSDDSEFITEFRCGEDYYEVLQYNSEYGISEEIEKQFS